MLQVIVLLVVGLLALKSKPESASFKAYLETVGNNVTHSQQQPSWFRRLSAAFSRPTIPDFKIHDYGLFMIAQTEDGGQFIGAFGSWFLISSQPAAVTDVSIQVDEQAEKLRENAIRYKADRKYALAAASFLEAARKYSHLADTSGKMQAGKCYEDSSIMYKLSGQDQKSLDMLEHAASIFASLPNLETRAAKIYETLSEKVVNMDGVKAIRFLTKAQELYDLVGDGRSIYAEIARYNTLGQLKRFAEAFKGFESILPKFAEHTTLKFSLSKYALSAGVCAMGIPDITLLDKFVQACMVNPQINSTWEFNWIRNLLKYLRDEDEEQFAAAIAEIGKGSCESWYEIAFEKAKGRPLNFIIPSVT
ncbi:hypothetical protein HDU67_000095 [Dinochytrium kinnereticum]|nr:hypothetical protein HDU67_000095 [Dinochytrium kinnereticum]